MFKNGVRMNRWWIGIGVLLFLGVGAVVLTRFRKQPIQQQVAVEPGSEREEKQLTGEGHGKTVEVGGVRRPTGDFPANVNAAGGNQPAPAPTDGDDPFRYGKAPSVEPDANPQVAGVAAAIREERNPEQVSSLLRPQPFDPVAFNANPESYVNTIEPGRVFDVRQPKAGVPAIRKVSPRYQEVKQGESVYLRAAAPVGAPVTFTSLDLGQFENQLTSITVVTGDDGVAKASFTGTSGTINDVNIVAGSPLASGNVTFVVNVHR